MEPASTTNDQQSKPHLLNDSVLQLPCLEFYHSLATQPKFLELGYDYVRSYLSASSTNREQTLLNLFHPSVPIMTLVSRTYPIVFGEICRSDPSSNQWQKTRQYLIISLLCSEVLVADQISKARKSPEETDNSIQKREFKKQLNKISQILSFLSQFHAVEGYELWVSLYEQLMQELINKGCCSQLLCLVLKQTLKQSDDRVSCFSQHLIPFISKYQQSLAIDSCDSLQIIYYTLRSLAYMNGTEDEVLELEVDPFLKDIVRFIASNINTSPVIMNFSFKILTLLVTDYERTQEIEECQIVNQLKSISGALIQQFFSSINDEKSHQNSNCLEEDSEDEDELQTMASSIFNSSRHKQRHSLQKINQSTLKVLLYQFIELLSAMISCEEISVQADAKLIQKVCLSCLILSRAEYSHYNSHSDTYLADVEDEGEQSLRNKIVSFLLELFESEPEDSKELKAIKNMRSEVLRYCKVSLTQSNRPLESSLSEYYQNLGAKIRFDGSLAVLCQQSVSFLLYSLTDEILTSDLKGLESNKQQLMVSLGNSVKNQGQNFVQKVSSLNLLNKIVRSMNKSVLPPFLSFLLEETSQTGSSRQQIGTLMCLIRGIAYCSADIEITVGQPNSTTDVPLNLIKNLLGILFDPDTLEESTHLILQFLVKIIEKSSQTKLSLLQGVIPTESQARILEKFIHEGMLAPYAISVVTHLGTEELIGKALQEFCSGSVKNENIVLLLAEWVRHWKLSLSDADILMLMQIYRAEFLSKLIKEYLKTLPEKCSIRADLKHTLNEKIQPSWLMPMIGKNLLDNPKLLVVRTVRKITEQLTSQYEIENELLLPYFILLKNTKEALELIASHSAELCRNFIRKLLQYAALFQGPHLRVTTCNVLLNVAQVEPSTTGDVLALIDGYGNMEVSEWEDEELEGEGSNQGANWDSIVNRMLDLKIVNEEIEQEFVEVFKDQAMNMDGVKLRVAELKSNM